MFIETFSNLKIYVLILIDWEKIVLYVLNTKEIRIEIKDIKVIPDT